MFKTNQEVLITILLGSLLFLLLIVVIILSVIRYHFNQKKFIKEKEELQTMFNHELLQTQIEIQEQTLQQVSRELHDNLGQVASLIKINLSTLQFSNPEKAIEKIEDTKDLTRQLIADIKSLSVSLGSDRIAQVGLVKAIEIEVERLNKTGQFSASYELRGTAPVIDNDKSLILYRMAQEVLNNIIKHSRARHINILLHVNENIFILAFNDDGIGFNAEEKMNASGAGLHNLKSRAVLINAQLHIESLPGNGSSVTIALPV